MLCRQSIIHPSSSNHDPRDIKPRKNQADIIRRQSIFSSLLCSRTYCCKKGLGLNV